MDSKNNFLKQLNIALLVLYTKYNTQHMTSMLIKHLALPHALLASWLHALCFISCIVLVDNALTCTKGVAHSDCPIREYYVINLFLSLIFLVRYFLSIMLA